MKKFILIIPILLLAFCLGIHRNAGIDELTLENVDALTTGDAVIASNKDCVLQLGVNPLNGSLVNKRYCIDCKEHPCNTWEHSDKCKLKE